MPKRSSTNPKEFSKSKMFLNHSLSLRKRKRRKDYLDGLGARIKRKNLKR